MKIVRIEPERVLVLLKFIIELPFIYIINNIFPPNYNFNAIFRDIIYYSVLYLE